MQAALRWFTPLCDSADCADQVIAPVGVLRRPAEGIDHCVPSGMSELVVVPHTVSPLAPWTRATVRRGWRTVTRLEDPRVPSPTSWTTSNLAGIEPCAGA